MGNSSSNELKDDNNDNLILNIQPDILVFEITFLNYLKIKLLNSVKIIKSIYMTI